MDQTADRPCHLVWWALRIAASGGEAWPVAWDQATTIHSMEPAMKPLSSFLHRQLAYFIGSQDADRVLLFRFPRTSSAVFHHERAQIIMRRTEVLAWVFMILVDLWIIIDAKMFPPDVVNALIVGRLAASFGLGLLLVATLMLAEKATRLHSYLTLICLVAIPVLFHAYARSVFASSPHLGEMASTAQAAAILLYEQLPVIYIAGLALFPLTLLESAPIVLAITAAQAVSDMHGWRIDSLNASEWASLWVDLVIGGTAALAGLLQANTLWRLHRLADFDSETGLMTRGAALNWMQLNWHGREPTSKQIAVGVLAVPPSSQSVDRTTDEGGSVLRFAEWLRQHEQPNIQSVRWSGQCLGLVAIGHDGTTIQKILDGIPVSIAQGTGLQVAIRVVERSREHSPSPRMLVEAAERRLRTR